jgi:hypothetical protein
MEVLNPENNIIEQIDFRAKSRALREICPKGPLPMPLQDRDSMLDLLPNRSDQATRSKETGSCKSAV